MSSLGSDKYALKTEDLLVMRISSRLSNLCWLIPTPQDQPQHRHWSRWQSCPGPKKLQDMINAVLQLFLLVETSQDTHQKTIPNNQKESESQWFRIMLLPCQTDHTTDCELIWRSLEYPDIKHEHEPLIWIMGRKNTKRSFITNENSVAEEFPYRKCLKQVSGSLQKSKL